MNEFKTQVDLDVMLDLPDNHDIVTKKVNLRWNLELDMRQYGIKSFDISVPDQTLTIDVSIWGEDTDIEKEITLDVKDVLVERNGENDGLVPNTLEFYKGKWKLVFG